MKLLYHGTLYDFDDIDVSYDKLEESGYPDEVCEEVIAVNSISLEQKRR